MVTAKPKTKQCMFCREAEIPIGGKGLWYEDLTYLSALRSLGVP